MDYKCTVELKGDLFDSLRLTSVLDEIVDSGCVCKIKELKIGETKTEDSYARIKIRSEDKKILDIIFNSNARCAVQDIKIGLEKKDFSYAKIKISTTNQQIMDNLLEKIIKQGAVLVEQ